MMLRKILALFAVLALTACAATPTADDSSTSMASTPPGETLTILVSIDGFRADYLDRGVTPVMSRLAEEGARADMRSSFPTKTFPNHYTLVTGLRPDHHGIINNTMTDPRRPGQVFQIWDKKVASDPIWWEEGKPLWVSAHEQGVRTATMFWPGSDIKIHGVLPDNYEPFDQKLPDFARVDLLLSWLDAPQAERPQFLTLYFDIVDTAGHLYGPDSPKTISATAQVDASLGRLLDGLEARGLGGQVNIVIVADHGMAPIADDRIGSLDDYVTPEMATVIFSGAFIGIDPKPGHGDDLAEALIGKLDHAECWNKADIPARFHYGENSRVPQIICLPETGWRYETAAQKAWRNAGGDHGYDPYDPLMAALFIAHGPAIREGVRLAAFDNVSVYPLVAKLAGISPEPHDGDLEDVSGALVEQP